MEQLQFATVEAVTRATVLAADGRQLARVEHDLLSIGGRPVARSVVVAGAIDHHVWAVARGAQEHVLLRFDDRGAALGAPMPLGALGRDVVLVTGRATSPHALVEGEQAVAIREHDGELSIEALGERARDRRVLLPGRGVLERRGALLAGRRGVIPDLHIPTDLLGGTVTHGGLVLGTSAVIVEIEARAMHYLLLYDARTGVLRTRMRLGDASILAIAEQAGRIVIGRDRHVALIDVRAGRCVNECLLGAAAVHVAVDANGRRFEIVDGAGNLIELGADLVARDEAMVEVAGAAAARATVEVAGDAAARSPVEVESDVGSDLPAAIEPARGEPAAEPSPPPGPEPSPPPVRLDLATPAAPDAWSVPTLDGGPPRCLWPRLRARLGPKQMRAYVDDCFELVRSWCEVALAHVEDDETAARAADADRDAACKAYARWHARPTPLAAIAHDYGLSQPACSLLLIAAAPFLWGELAPMYRAIADDPQRPLVDEYLICQILDLSRAERASIARELDPDAPLVRHGLIEVGAGARPFAALEIHHAILARLASRGPATPAPADLARTDLSTATAGELVAALAAQRHDQPVRVVIRGRAGSGRATVATALGAWAGRRVEFVELVAGTTDDLADALRRIHASGAIACVTGLDHLGADIDLEHRVQAVLDRHPGPLFVRAGMHATPPLRAGYVVVDLPALARGERICAWRDALASHGLATDAAPALADAFSVGRAAAAEAAAVVAASPHATRSTASVIELVDRAVRQARARRLARLATPITRLASWHDLVLPDDLLGSLREMIARVRLRSLVLEDWGLERVSTTARGVCALFQGGPGTGKTLAAGVIARELGFDLYRVDLSQVVSKWVGETEKNLAELFDAAEDGRCVLLLDEADSLLARRSEVKSSNDRYGNMEINYVLQRLDTFEGIAILTTNLGTALDPALVRRLSLHLQFPFPDEDMREQLWRAHLPANAPIVGELALRDLATRHQLSGGYIRNAAIRAAFLAAATGEALCITHLQHAVELGYRDRGNLGRSARLE